MPAEDIYSWSVTSALNGTSDPGIAWPEGQTRESVNNSARAMMAAHAKDRDWQTGASAVGGVVNALTFFSGNNYTAVPVGFTIRLKIPADKLNTGACTLNMDNIGPVAIYNNRATALTGGELIGYRDFRWDGTYWVLLQPLFSVVIQKFTASGTYTPTSGMVRCIIECVGGGGGGAAVLGVFGFMYMGAGGGSGGYSRKLATATEVGASQVVTIGAGGGGGQYNVAGGVASAGGQTSVGSLCIAMGARAGSGWYACGQGAAATGTGDIVAGGAPGHGGAVMDATHGVAVGEGGSSIMGGGAPNQGWPNDSGYIGGLSATNYGSGGGGASTNNTTAGPQGGDGSAGIAIITEFISL